MSPNPLPSETGGLSSKQKLCIMAAACSLYFFSYFQRVAVPGTLFNAIQTDHGLTGGGAPLSAGAVTLLGAIYLYIYSGSQLFIGIIIDRFGPARVLLTGGAALAVGFVAFPLMKTLPALYLARALVAAGAAVMYLCLIKMLDEFFSPRLFPQLLSVVLFMGYAGAMTATVPLQMATNAWGWRTPLLALGILSCLAYAVALLLRRRGWKDAPRTFVFDWSIVGKVLFNWRAYPVLLCNPINFSIYFLLQGNIGKKMLEDCCGIPAVSGAGTICIMLFTAMIGTFLAGFAPRYMDNRRKPLAIASTIITLATVAALYCGLQSGATAGYFLGCFVGLAVSISSVPAMVSLLKESSPREGVAIAVGLINGMSYLAVAILCSVAGFILDCYRESAVVTAERVIYPMEAYRGVFVVLFGMAIVSCVLAWLIRETRGEHIYRHPDNTPVADEFPE